MTDKRIRWRGEIEMVDAADLQPAAYNPRDVVAERLDLVELSLRKLGWLLPIYATPEGRILSGHQRHHVSAERLGAKQFPVVRVGLPNRSSRERGLNLIFNRITNDMVEGQDGDTLYEALERSNVWEIAEQLPDLDLNSTKAFPIMKAVDTPLADVLDANPLWLDHGTAQLAGYMTGHGIEMMPIVCTSNLQIVNGRARAAAAARKNFETIRVCKITKKQAALAGPLLNLLSMRYDLAGKMADDFRANAFRAAPPTRKGLSVNACWDIMRSDAGGHKSSVMYFDLGSEEHKAAWLAYYGQYPLDFGAGMYVDAGNMERIGATVTAFEPYYQYDRELAREAAEQWFFSRLREDPEREFSTIFLSNVINSVPFEEDRRHIVTLTSALASPDTLLATSTRATEQLRAARRTVNRSGAVALGRIQVGYERNCELSPWNRALVQKHHDRYEYEELWRRGWGRVEGSHPGGSWQIVRATRPIRPTVAALRAAIKFEFDLPYAGAPSLGLVDEAMEVFKARGWKL